MKIFNYGILKRPLDFILSIVLIITLSPLLLVISLIIIFEGNPIIFIQKRIGQYNKTFYIFKFRTLTINAPKNIPTNQFTNLHDYVTPIGKFLRKTSFDELPQLFNILIGDMSFIGPRPLLWNEFDLIKLRALDKTNLVKPGLSGLAQISTSARENQSEKLRMDKIYVENFSLKQDIIIIMNTIYYLFNRFIN